MSNPNFPDLNSEVSARLVHYQADGTTTEEIIPTGVTHIQEKGLDDSVRRNVSKPVSDLDALKRAELLGFSGRLDVVTKINTDGTEGESWYESSQTTKNDKY